MPVLADNFRLLKRTRFGFDRLLQWPAAVQRSVFFALASAGEVLAATRLFGWLLNGLARVAAALLTLLTPHAAADLESEPPRHGLLVLVLAALLAGFVISVGGNAVFTLLEGTFSGDDPRRYYYSRDPHNLFLYAFVAPIYMAASAAIIYCALSALSLTGRTDQPRGSLGRVWPVLRLGFVLSWIVLLAGVVQVNYFHDNIMGLAKANPESLKPACRDRVFWFVNEIAGKDGKVLSLNSAGVYYLCMQFCHMAVIAAAVWFIVTGMFTLYRLGLDLTPEYLARNGGAEPVRKKLKRFSLLEISGKWLALILLVHIYIWRDSCLKGEHNIRVTAMFLVALSLFVLATPRLLIEYRMLKCAAVERENLETNIEWPDLVDQRDKLMSTIVSCVHFMVQITLAALIAKVITIAIG
jgi:hypothetical protein